jgi:hypothetical protein
MEQSMSTTFGSAAMASSQLSRLHLHSDAEGPMYFAAVVLAISSAVFYAAGQHEIGRFGADVCRYGGAFCENPTWVLAGAGLAAAWGKFVSVR